MRPDKVCQIVAIKTKDTLSDNTIETKKAFRTN